MDESVEARVVAALEEQWLPLLPAGWQRATLFRSVIAMKLELWSECVEADGTTRRVEVPNRLDSIFGRAQVRSGERGKRSWISVTASATPDAGITVTENWDARVYWGQHPGAPWEPQADGAVRPTDDEYRSEFTTGHPRPPEYWPSWLPSIEHEQAPADRLRDALGRRRSDLPAAAWLRPALHVTPLAELAARATAAVTEGIASVDSHAEVDRLLGDDVMFDRDLQPVVLGGFVDRVIEPIDEEVSALDRDALTKLWRELTAATTVPDSPMNEAADDVDTERAMRHDLTSFVNGAACDEVVRRFGVTPEWR